MTTEPGGADRLQHRLLGADGLYDRVRAEPIGEPLNPRDTRMAALVTIAVARARRASRPIAALRCKGLLRILDASPDPSLPSSYALRLGPNVAKGDFSAK